MRRATIKGFISYLSPNDVTSFIYHQPQFTLPSWQTILLLAHMTWHLNGRFPSNMNNQSRTQGVIYRFSTLRNILRPTYLTIVYCPFKSSKAHDFCSEFKACLLGKALNGLCGRGIINFPRFRNHGTSPRLLFQYVARDLLTWIRLVSSDHVGLGSQSESVSQTWIGQRTLVDQTKGGACPYRQRVEYMYIPRTIAGR